MKNDGGPAFPNKYFESGPEGEPTKCTATGMSLRDYFAAKAMQGMAAEMVKGGYPKPEFIESQNEMRWMSEYAYSLADAMLAARES